MVRQASPGGTTHSTSSSRLRGPGDGARWIDARRVIVVAVVGIMLLASTVSPVTVSASQDNCIQSGPESLDYKMNICLSTTGSVARVSGTITVTVAATIDGTDPGTRRVVFYMDGNYVLTDYQTPYTFQLNTEQFSNGSHQLEVEYVMRDAFVSSRATETLDIENSPDSSPIAPPTFTPSTGRPAPQGEPFVVAVAGDGAGGEKNEFSVTDLISSWDPNLVLYLGDVYDQGSPAEFANWYGGPNSLFGRFRSITDPVVGNHEYQTPNAAGYFGYWDGIPHYYSFDAGGWHFIALDSTTEFKQTSLDSPQVKWLEQDLANNRSVCTLVFLHHPFFSVGEHGNSPQLTDIWPLLVANGVDIALSGHDHSYQRWNPLGANGSPDAKGTTQFVVGTGGHSLRNNVQTATNVATTVDTPSVGYGALRLSLTPSSATYDFLNIKGATLDSGTVNCSTSGARQSASMAASNQTPVAGTTSGSVDAPSSNSARHATVGSDFQRFHILPALLVLVLLAVGIAMGFVFRVVTEDSDSS